MVRVKRGNVARKRRKKVLKIAKGYVGSHSRLFRPANQQVMKALKYSYRHRRERKRDFRSLWITRLNAAARMEGLSYSRLIDGLNKAEVRLNRKVLSQLAVLDPPVFAAIVSVAKNP
ncbi:50S ribosomal protein L20 [Anthocerotibacter panamensis]|uniref:50S ribosomal protein L20 n=1 Tax=Anthocerotibacter panamensis TaxID=2857077 RepID=UPI001C4025B9|nr:50S ribosomal protein L20 [Anthocerotibacter panamensis]